MDEPWVEKYRPKTLDEIVGQDEIVKRLKKYVEKKSMPHLLFSGPPGVGKCLTGDTKVIVNGEIREIGEVVDEISNGKFGATLSNDLKVLGVDDEGKVREFNVQYVYKDKTNALIRIKTKMGRELKVTTYHPLLINNKNGEIKWEKAENLKVGDKLATPRYILFDNNDKDIENHDLVRWIAYYVAEGYIKDSKVIFSHNNKKIINKFLELTKRLFKDVKIENKDNLVYITSNEVKDIIREYNLTNKRIPNNIMKSDTLKVFLDAYIECEGIKKDNKIILPTTNKDFAEELSYALLRYGVIVKLEKVNNIYKIIISEEISDKIIVDVEKINYICEKLGIKNVKLKSNILEYIECRKLCNAILNRIYNQLDKIRDNKLLDCIGYLLFLASNEIYWDEIVEIEQLYGDFIIYDLHVPKYHNFVGGNLPTILHNTTAALCLTRDLFGENWRENFLELNASDERGIDVIRTKVKEFARTKPIGDIPFKIIFLDESDALTADAQNALRRIMEKFSNVCRFILSCNYPSKIIPPIQSRCAVFRFSPLKKEDIAKKLKEIAEKENLKLTESGLDAIIYVSEGDLRKAINVLQTAAALSNVIDDEIIYKVSSRARPEEVKKMMELALEGKFMEARDLLYKLMVEWGMSGEDILNQMFREINNLNIDERKKVELADYIGETDFRIVEGANERIQLSSLLAKMALLGKK